MADATKWLLNRVLKNRPANPAWLVVFSCWAVGCLSSEEPAPLHSEEGLQVLAVNAYDWTGRAAPIHAIPRRPLIELEVSAAVDAATEPAMLVYGTAESQLLEDLERRPMRAGNAQRVVPCAVSYERQKVTLRPEAPLEALATYAVLLAGWARSVDGQQLNADGAPFSAELEVSGSIHAGASAVEAWPADGTAGVAPNLLFAAIRFDGQVAGEQEGVWVEDADGAVISARVGRQPCEAVGWEGGVCVLIEPLSPLAAGEHYRIAVGDTLKDSRGAPIVPWTAAFHTASQPDHQPPSLLSVPCALDERETPNGCALVSDQGVELEVRADEPVRLQLATAQRKTTVLAARGQGRMSLDGLEPNTRVTLELSGVDAAGNRSLWPLSVRTEEEMASLSITEVRANPHGPEPQQEFVELTNYGDSSLDLQGFSLSDDVDSQGDVIGHSAFAHPGVPVLLVSDRFDPEDPSDDAPPPGTQLVHLGTSLGDSGLSNSGEALFLRDRTGRRISAAPAIPQTRAGVCIVRVTDDMRDGSADAFAHDPQGRCTPGR